MSRSRMQQARQLIADKRYKEARAILKSIDDPRARDWLKRIDKLDPQKKRGSGGVRAVLGYLLVIVISAVLTIALLAGLVIVTASSRGQARIQAVEDAQATVVAEAATDTPTPDLRTGVVNSTQNINVRSEPNTGSSAVAALVPGTTVVVLGENEDGSWYNVQLTDGRVGWIAAQLLNAEPAPTEAAPSGENTPVAGVTPTPEETCTTEEAQAWYDDNFFTISKINFAILQVAADAEQNIEVDYQRLAQRVRENIATFEQADYPPCIEDVRSGFLEGYRSLANSFQNYARGDISRAVSDMNNVQARFAPINDLLVNQLGVRTTITDCGAEIWYAGLAEDINTYLALIDGITATTPPSNDIRSAIFDIQALRRTSEVAYPECATEANNHLLLSMDAAVKLFQAIMSEDAVTAQNELNTVVNERTAFLRELQSLGVPLIRDTE